MAFFDPISGMPVRRRGQPGYRGVEDELGMIGGPPAFRPSATGGIAPTGPASSGYRSLLNIPGTQPDFLGILNADPILSQFRSGLGAEGVADRAQRDALIQRALIGFGEVPDFSAAAGALGLPGDELSGIANPETRALAQKNTEEGLSTVGRLEREFERVRQNIMDALAARGALRSGATGVALQDLQQDRKVAQVDARQQLLDYIGEYTRGYLEGQRQRARDLAAAQTQAAGRIPEEQLAGTPEEEADFAGWSSDGRPVYKGRKTGRVFFDDRSIYGGEVLATDPAAASASRPSGSVPQPTGRFFAPGEELYRAGRLLLG